MFVCLFVCWFGLVLSTDAECIRYLEEAIDEPDLRYYLEKWHPANIAKVTPPARHACPKCSAHNAVQPKVRPVPARYLLVLFLLLLLTHDESSLDSFPPPPKLSLLLLVNLL